jgi:uncharacterized protein (DUF1778 family)
MPQSKPKKKMGRPKLPNGAAKGRVVTLRLNAADLKMIEAAAKEGKLTLSEWIRQTASAAAGATEK